MTRFWVSWWSGYYASEGCTEPPFQIWESGIRERRDGKEEISICAVIDAASEDIVWEAVERHFPDYTPRFCEAKTEDWKPGDRFPDFQNRTQLAPKEESL